MKQCPGCGFSYQSAGAFMNHVRYNKTGCTTDARFWGRVVKGQKCWIWTGALQADGYGNIQTRRGKNAYAHRLSWEMANGPIPDGLHVLHSCDTPSCVNPAHLSLGTHVENMADCDAKGRKARGERTLRNKLTDADVIAIRRAYVRTGRQSSNASELAEQYGVLPQTIINAAEGRTWSHL